MNNIVIAFVFILFRFSLDLNGHILNLIPTFIGYYFLHRGLNELHKMTSKFTKIRTWTKGAFIFTIVNWFVQLIFSELGGVLTILKTVEDIFNIVITYQVIAGFVEYEREYKTDIYAVKLRSAWTVAIGLSLVASVFMVIPNIYQIVSVILLFAHIYIIVRLYKTKQAYEAQSFKQ